jgi:hypothetical protein
MICASLGAKLAEFVTAADDLNQLIEDIASRPIAGTVFLRSFWRLA